MDEQRWKKKFKGAIKKITRDKDKLEIDTARPIELDEQELKRYIDLVVREVRKKHENVVIQYNTRRKFFTKSPEYDKA